MSMVSSLSSASAISSNGQTSTSGPPVYVESSSTALQSSASASLSETSAFGAGSSTGILSSSSLVSSLPATDQTSPSTSSGGSPPSYSGGEDSTTTTLPPTYVSVSTFSSQESPIPTCGAGSDTASISAGGDSTLCQDPYGNTYEVSYGSKQYTGRVTKRAVTSNVNECLLLCNLEADCEGVNYVGDTCTIFA